VPLKGFTVKSRLGDYRVFFKEPGEYLPQLAAEPDCVFAVDENVWSLYKDSALEPVKAARRIILPVSEEAKSLASVQKIYDRLLEFSSKKNIRLVSIGGGIVQDITGFAASTLYRGINWIFVPTTLLAQADSCIGAKTSLNYGKFKNLIGTFYPPREIYISASFLGTLKESDYLSGLGEIAKLCVIGGEASARDFAGSLDKLLGMDAELLRRSLRTALDIKRGYIETDELDSGRRNMLNYGHCFGHAIEAATDFSVGHGTAVVCGMALANTVALRRGLLSPENEEFIRVKILDPLFKPCLSLTPFRPDAVIEAMKKDKKRTGAKLALVMAADGFKMSMAKDLDEAEARSAIEEFNAAAVNLAR